MRTILVRYIDTGTEYVTVYSAPTNDDAPMSIDPDYLDQRERFQRQEDSFNE